ncbi:hypothetical protein T440DRAFT_553118 [Plenodomus tracheiphilus IPT5]|uniref:Phytase-like domain-containing protein n=1 Tax=Plenodomus tracheiphilus IPT5 TaxID=1408161 RepID=A0A6A7BBV6_9PLEO|nr:hypothetical protein T440DRAFT_553118 [Plenodomus tracheiphilus IPT5]
MILPITLSILVLPLTNVFANPLTPNAASTPVNVTTCNGKKYVYSSLAGYGLLPSNARDKHGDTIGGIGSAIALDKSSLKFSKRTQSYSGIIYGLPDRGWNTQGTQNTQSRIHKISFTFNIVGDKATVANPASPNFKFEVVDTILLTGPDETPLTGLDPTDTITYPGFPTLPLAKYTGNGFGQPGSGGSRIPLDTEGLVLGPNSTFYISDEYAATIYHFSSSGTMISATPPPPALLPRRNSTLSFSAASPPIYAPNTTITPEDPTTGRANNQGLEALTMSPDGKYLYTMLQSATMQDGGKSSSKRRNTRFLVYRISSSATLKLEAEYQFLVLARDSGAGRGQAAAESVYRNADVIDISGATNILGTSADDVDGQVASRDGKLKDGITPAVYCPWLSFNVNSQLNRFGVRNGGAQDAGLLNEKWESFAVLPVDKDDEVGKSGKEKEEGDDYYLLSFSDNDFITQNGYINNGQTQYQDASGFNLDSQVLVFKVKFPKGAKPL